MAELVHTDAIALSEDTRPFKASQKLLRQACKRMRLSCNITKAVLVERLEKADVKTKDHVKDLVHKFDTDRKSTPAANTVVMYVHTSQHT